MPQAIPCSQPSTLTHCLMLTPSLSLVLPYRLDQGKQQRDKSEARKEQQGGDAEGIVSGTREHVAL
eukprot:754965-Hanusia_phi.AAC.3